MRVSVDRRGGRRGWLAIAAALSAAAMGFGPPAAHAVGARSRGSVIVRPHFRSLGPAAWVWAGSRTALVEPASNSLGNSVQVLSDSGRRRQVSSPDGCPAVEPGADTPLNPPWVVFSCRSASAPVELRSLSTGQEQTVTPNSTNANPCVYCDVSASVADAGTQWLHFDRQDCPGDEHCGFSNLYQNIASGIVRPDPARVTDVIDLDAPNLTRPACAPLTVPSAAQEYGPPLPGSLRFYGTFALAIGTDAKAVPTAYLERCGTHLHQLLVKGPYPASPIAVAANTKVLIWKPTSGPVLAAMTLPARRRFSIQLPNELTTGTCTPAATTDCVSTLALTPRWLYVLMSSGELWVIPTPIPPQHRARAQAQPTGGRISQDRASARSCFRGKGGPAPGRPRCQRGHRRERLRKWRGAGQGSFLG